MDPRAKSVADAKKGIKNLDQWNMDMPLSADDKKRHMVSNAYFGVWAVVFTYWVYAAHPI